MAKKNPAKKLHNNKISKIDDIDFPIRSDIVSFIKNNYEEGREVSKREIAKAFKITGQQRILLKALLRELAAEGIYKKKKKLSTIKDHIPSVTVLEILDADDLVAALPFNTDNTKGNDSEDEISLKENQFILIIDNNKLANIGKLKKGDRVLARIRKLKKSKLIGDQEFNYDAKVIKKIINSKKQILGVLRVNQSGNKYIIPVDKKNRSEFIIKDSSNDYNDGDIVFAEIPPSSRRNFSQARIIDVLGSLNKTGKLSFIAIYEHEIPHIFPDEVMLEVERLDSKFTNFREDLRSIPFITIDPADARDHDDAVWAAKDDDPNNIGGFKVVVAIADVANYVMTGSAIDREAYNRGNSTYFPDQVVPMLPEKLSNDLCSLKPNEERPALAVSMYFNKDGHKISHQFTRAIIKSHYKLSYEQAQKAKDGANCDVPVKITENILKPLWSAFYVLDKAREVRQPLDLDVRGQKIVLDPDGKIEKIIFPERLEAHRLIEEFMIQANVAAAETLKWAKKDLIYRSHDAPSDEKLASLTDFLDSIGMKFNIRKKITSENFNYILNKTKNDPNCYLINEVILRSQSQAVYYHDNKGHFGLNLENYAHFTSPIRRYADLLIHRELIDFLESKKDSSNLNRKPQVSANQIDWAEIASHLCITERRSMLAERNTIDRLVAAYMEKQLGSDFTARISGITKAGIFISLDINGADGFIPISTLANDFFIFDEERRCLWGRRSGAVYQLGDIVDVRLVEVVALAGSMRFEMLSKGQKGNIKNSKSRNKIKNKKLRASCKKR